jgi:hypothetical protein
MEESSFLEHEEVIKHLLEVTWVNYEEQLSTPIRR